MGLDMYLKAKTYVDKHDWNQRFGEERRESGEVHS